MYFDTAHDAISRYNAALTQIQPCRSKWATCIPPSQQQTGYSPHQSPPVPTSPVSCPNPFHHSLYPCNLLSDILFLWFIEAVIIPLKFNSNLFIVFFSVFIFKKQGGNRKKVTYSINIPQKIVSGREARAARASYMDQHMASVRTESTVSTKDPQVQDNKFTSYENIF